MSVLVEATTDERVTAAAVRLFGAQGFAATGIRELARASGISVASLYHYMATKDDLLLSLMLEGMNSLLVPATDALASANDPVDGICKLVGIHINFHCNRAALARVTDAEIRALSGDARDQVIRLRDDYEELWLSTIEAGGAAGTFHLNQPKLATFAVLEMCTGVSHWYSPDGAYSVTAIASYYSALSLRMLGYRKAAVIRQLELAGDPVAS